MCDVPNISLSIVPGIPITGKLNSSKGFDTYGKSIIKILNKFTDWKALAIGNEPREKYNFNHKNLKVHNWLPHKKILNLDRNKIFLSQTPQAFNFKKIFNLQKKRNSKITDDASLFEMLNWKVKIIEGNYSNIKVTSPIDLEIAKLFLKDSYT